MSDLKLLTVNLRNMVYPSYLSYGSLTASPASGHTSDLLPCALAKTGVFFCSSDTMMYVEEDGRVPLSDTRSPLGWKLASDS